jgi:hypothetical protein
MLVFLHLSLVLQVYFYTQTNRFNCIYISILLAVSHVAGNNSIVIRNTMVIGSITPNDCNDTLNTTTVNWINGQKAFPTVSATSSTGDPGGRSGIVFPFFSLDNMMPRHPWTNIDAYPCSKFLKTTCR